MPDDWWLCLQKSIRERIFEMTQIDPNWCDLIVSGPELWPAWFHPVGCWKIESWYNSFFGKQSLNHYVCHVLYIGHHVSILSKASQRHIQTYFKHAKIVNEWKPLTILAKSSILDVWQFLCIPLNFLVFWRILREYYCYAV